jgi:hypothetical protein
MVTWFHGGQTSLEITANHRESDIGAHPGPDLDRGKA